MALARDTKLFADGSRPKLSRFKTDERAEICAAYDAQKHINAQPRASKRIDVLKSALPSPPIPSHIPPIVPRGEFESWWSRYPRKVDRQAAARAWVKLKPDPWQAAVLTAAVEEHGRSADWAKDDGAFIPYGSTWLNGSRWEDKLKMAPPPPPPEWDPAQDLQVWSCRNPGCPIGGIHESPNLASMPKDRRCSYLEAAHG